METLFFATCIAYGLVVCIYLIQFILYGLTSKLTTEKIAPNIASMLYAIIGITALFTTFLLLKEEITQKLWFVPFILFTSVAIISLFFNYHIYKKLIENTKKQ